MSMKSRARALAARAADAGITLTHQQALSVLRELGSKPTELAQKHHWPLTRADVFAYDPNLDEEYRDASRGSRYVSRNSCDNCDATFFQGFDKKGTPTGGSDTLCPGCIEQHGSWECPKCGAEVLGDDEDGGVCGDCWGYLMSDD